MNMTDSMISQLMAVATAVQTPAPKSAEQAGVKREDFDALMRQKQDAVESTVGQKPQQAGQKDGAEAETRPVEGEKVVPEEQRVLAAALAAQAAVIVPLQDAAASVEDAIPQAPVAAVSEVQAVMPVVENAPQQAKAEPEEQGRPDTVITHNSAEAPRVEGTPITTVPEQKAETADGVQQKQGEQSTEAHNTRPEKGSSWYKDVRLERVREQDGMTVEVSSEMEPQPLFQEAEIPVKVGQPETLVRTEDGELDGNLASKVKEAVEQGESRVEVKLSPRSMGDVTIELTRSQDGALHVALHATTERGASLLSEHVNGLSALLQGGTQAPVSVEVQRPQELQQPQQSQQQQQADKGWDGHQGNPNQQQGQQQQRHQDSQDFLQQLRLGLFTPDVAVS